MKHCVECGTKLISKYLDSEKKEIPFCPTCQQYRFPMYNVAVSMIVTDLKTDKILLIQQYNRQRYILVAGYVNWKESVENAVIREVKEETGLDVVSLSLNKTKFYEPSNTLMINFKVYVEDGSKISCNEEIDSYQWFTKEEAKQNIYPNSLAEEFLLHSFE